MADTSTVSEESASRRHQRRKRKTHLCHHGIQSQRVLDRSRHTPLQDHRRTGCICGRLRRFTIIPLGLSFVYSPKQSTKDSDTEAPCQDVVITSNLLHLVHVSLSESSLPWRLDDLTLDSIPGKCQQDMTFYRERLALPKIANLSTKENDGIPTWLNRTLNITVKNGFTFKTVVVFPFQSEFKLIHKMELRDENNLLCDNLSWISLSTREFALYGLPLTENVRSLPYNFRLDVMLKSGATQVVAVVIVVQQFTPMLQHIFEIAISLSESDTVALSSSSAGGLLPLSQTLLYRWLLVQTLDSYLQSGSCRDRCGMNIFTHKLSEHRPWLVNFSWSMLLDHTGSSVSCDNRDWQALAGSLFLPDSSTASIRNYSARPNDALIKSFISQHLGTPTSVTAKISSSCSSPYQDIPSRNQSSRRWLNITVSEGSLFAIALVPRKTIVPGHVQRTSTTLLYFTNGSRCNLRWLQLSPGGDVLFGLPLSEDTVDTSTVLLRIEIGEDAASPMNVTIEITIVTYSENEHLFAVRLNLTITSPWDTVLLRTRTVQLLNQYLQPSCSLLTNYSEPTEFKFLDSVSDEMALIKSCEKAESVVLHRMTVTTRHGQTTLTADFSLRYCQTNKSSCDLDSINTMNLEFFENSSKKTVSKELIQFFGRSGLGVVMHVELCLRADCPHGIGNGASLRNICPGNDLLVKQSAAGSRNSKIVLLVLFLVTMTTVCLCLGVFFVKRTLCNGTSKLKSTEDKDTNSSDRTKEPKNSLKSPLPSLAKKPKKLATQESSGASVATNSPTTPLLPSVPRDDTKSERQKEPVFSSEDMTGSYSCAASRTKFPELDMCPSTEVGVPMCAVKQPNTCNVIRNPAMMMGSRLNPYRNLPPPI